LPATRSTNVASSLPHLQSKPKRACMSHSVN